MSGELLLNRVRALLDQQQFWRPDVCIVVAVSGGPDSLCLLHVLVRLHHEGGPAIHAAHLDHGFRGTQSAAEAQGIASLADTWQVPATVDYCDVPALARSQRQNTQAAARQARYAFLASVAHRVDATAVAVAHQADDQAETLLLHLLRGAGPAGLRGMQAVVPWHEWREATDSSEALQRAEGPYLLRPLLDSSRSDIEAYCTDHGLTPFEDPSNRSLRYTRNRLRSDLLPRLATYNPHIVAAMSRTARICADDYAYIQQQLDQIWPDLTETRPGAVYLHAERWHALPVALQRYALRRAAQQLVGSDEAGYDLIEAARLATMQGTGYQQTMGQNVLLRVEHRGFLVQHLPTYVQGTAAADAFCTLPQLAAERVPLNVPGSTSLSATWYAETTTEPPADSAQLVNQVPPWRWSVLLDADTLDGPLAFRQRRQGDRLRPAGGVGSRRLKVLFIDYKVPHELRAAWPVLATPTSIVWVAGLRADERFQATAATQHTLWVVLRRGAECR